MNSYEFDQDASPARMPNNYVHGSKGKTVEPILLMDIDENGKFVVSKRAINLISSIETHIAIISIAGQYRTGKSFLLNRFAGQQKGFATGPSTNPCTKGIWIWGEPIQISETLSVILLDTEGLHSYERDENIDAKLFVLTCLLSSTLIYNVMNVIDERALENLSFMTNMSKYIAPDVQNYLPNFVWVVRDFALDFSESELKHEKPALAYMENSLRLNEETSPEMVQKNEIRLAIIKYFKQRDCFTLVRPVHEETKLRVVDQLPYGDLRKEFRNEVDTLVKAVMGRCQPKIIGNAPLVGKNYCELIASYVQTLNHQGIPSIISAWERIVDKEYRQLKNEISQVIIDFVTNDVTPNLPVAPEILQATINKKHAECQDMILQVKLSSEKQFTALLQLRKDFDDLLTNQLRENALKSKKLNNIIANKMIEVLSKVTETSKYQNISTIIKETNNLKKIYFQEAHSPTAHEIYVNNFVENLLRIIERVYNNIKMDEQQKVEQLQGQIEVLKAQNEAIQKILKEEKENLHKQIDSVKKTLNSERKDQEKRFLELQSSLRQGYKIQQQSAEQNLFTDPDAYIRSQHEKEEKSYMKELRQQMIDLSDQITQMEGIQTEISQKIIDQRVEQTYKNQLNELRADYDDKVDRMKLSYDTEVRILKEENKRLDDIREKLQIALVEKDCEVKLYKERIRGYEKNKTKEVEHADMLCKISDQLLRVMKKIDSRDR